MYGVWNIVQVELQVIYYCDAIVCISHFYKLLLQTCIFSDFYSDWISISGLLCMDVKTQETWTPGPELHFPVTICSTWSVVLYIWAHIPLLLNIVTCNIPLRIPFCAVHLQTWAGAEELVDGITGKCRGLWLEIGLIVRTPGE